MMSSKFKFINLTSQELTTVPNCILNKKETETLFLDFNFISTISISLCNELINLTCLSLNGNELETLPENVGDLTLLNEIYLKENLLSELPDSITKLKYLRKLYITANEIKLLPNNFSSLQNLTEFEAAENQLEELPSDFGLLQSLSYLDLNYNNIKQLPDSFGSLISLKEIDISNNQLKSLPQSFQNLKSVEILDLSHNDLNCLPENFDSAENITKIFLSDNRIARLPEWFSRLIKVKEIYLLSNRLTGNPFPDGFGDLLNNLEHLDFRGNCIEYLPSSFGNLKKLKNLHLGTSGEQERKRKFRAGNLILRIPDSFIQLCNLTVLELDENDIEELPNEFGCLSNIIYLNLSLNQLKSLPDSFCKLHKMEVCFLSLNSLTHLPEKIGCLSSLKELRLDENELTGLPESFERLQNLVTLDLHDNKLTEIPTCLKNLKSLKMLYLGENNFDLKSDENPELFVRSRYIVADRDLEDNWHNRVLDDLKVSSYKEGREKLPDLISYAVKYSPSLWKRHLDYYYEPHKPKRQGDFVISKEEECWDIDFHASSGDYVNNKDEECWDVESPASLDEEEEPDFEDISDSDWEADNLDFPSPFKRIYMHPAKTEFTSDFVPSDLHVKPIDRTRVMEFTEEGQFDDAD